MQKFTLAILLVVFSVSASHAQSAAACTRALVNSEQAFDQGRLLFILDRSRNRDFYSCLENDIFEADEEVRANKLLTQTYIFIWRKREFPVC